MRALLTGIFPALERELEVTGIGPLTLLTGYQTPGAIRRIGASRLAAWLRRRGVYKADALAQAAVDAAARQRTVFPGEHQAAQLVATLARQVLELFGKVADLDRQIAARFGEHRQAKVILSLPGMGPLLGAEFLAATGGDMDWFETPDRLAGIAGLAPAPRDSGRVSGNHHRPQRFHRGLQRVFYMSAQSSIRGCEESRLFYERKRAEGKRHVQAVLALARWRVNVLWALLREDRCFEPARCVDTPAGAYP